MTSSLAPISLVGGASVHTWRQVCPAAEASAEHLNDSASAWPQMPKVRPGHEDPSGPPRWDWGVTVLPFVRHLSFRGRMETLQQGDNRWL